MVIHYRMSNCPAQCTLRQHLLQGKPSARPMEHDRQYRERSLHLLSTMIAEEVSAISFPRGHDSTTVMASHASTTKLRANETSQTATIDDQTLLPASTFGRVNNNDNRTSSNSKTLSYADDGAAMFGSVPFMLDPQDTLMEEASPLSRSSDYVEAKSKPERATSRDYFGRAPTAGSQRNSSMRETMQESSRRSSVEGAREASPHIASQAREQDRKPSDHISEAMKQRTSARTSQQTTPSIASPAPQQTPQNESGFKLQDAPRPRKTSTSQRTSEQEARSSAASTPVIDQIERPSGRNVPTPRGNDRDRNIDAPPRLVERISYVFDDWPSPGVASPRSIQQTLSKEVERPKRGDSLAAATLKPVSRKEVGSASTSGPTTPTVPQPTHGRDTSLSSSSHNGSRLGHHPVESPESTSKTAFEPPPRAASRPNMMRNEPSDSSKDVFTMPRVPPPAPPNNIARHGPSASLASMSSMRSDMSQSTQKSPNLPPGSTGGDFSMAEELERIMQEGGNEEANMRSQTSVLRKVSNAVKHGRSFSDRPARSERSSQSNSRDWPKSPLNGSMEISSPTSATSPATAHEENVLLKNRLRQAQDRISRLEVEKNGLQELVTNNVDISQVNTELRQKRSTMAILDTQREVVVRELEVMTDHLKRAKDTNRALDLNELKSGINRDFAASLQKLKDSLGQEIEKLMQKRADLGREIDDLIQMKDKGFEEYEALSTRNHQLSKHNNELIQSIQGNMKASAHHQHGEHGNSFDGGRQPPNGLGLYIAQNSRQGMRQEQQADVRHLQDSSTDYSQTTIITDPDADPIVVASPQVIKIGKGKANVFKKGTQGFVKGLRNVRKEFASERTDRSTERNNSLPYSNSLESTQGTPYGSMSQGQGPESGSRVDMQPYNRATPTEQPRQRIGDFFRGQGGNEKTHLRHLKQGNNGSFQNLAESAGNANLIFGIQLTTRCEYEKRFVPYIVTRCIEEVELRGMDVEGIYRKSGGTGQVNQIRAGFERDNDFDISDPELDIHAVTSALKQFLRKLPMPLISYDVYEDLLDCARIEDQRARAQPMKEAIQGLPKAHRDCLEFLMFHLAKVMAQEKQNLVGSLLLLWEEVVLT